MKFRKPRIKAGHLLLSEPFNPEPTFRRSVILISQHDKRGSIGFILNKPTHLRIHEALEDFPEFNALVYWGGAVNYESVFYVHKLGDRLPGSVEIIKGIYWGGDYKTLKLLVDNGEVNPEEIRFVAGYSAWNPEKLELEINQENWWVTEADKQKIFDEKPDEVWGNILKEMGHVYGVMNNFPEDPCIN
jgi:putative transcriptional regulator